MDRAFSVGYWTGMFIGLVGATVACVALSLCAPMWSAHVYCFVAQSARCF